MKNPLRGTFRSLNGFNYRVWAGGAFVSNIGTWMQRHRETPPRSVS